MREMMRRLLVKGRDAGQHIAGLWASESNIYGRFGYGISGGGNIAKIDTRDSRFRTMPSIDGEVRFADHAKIATSRAGCVGKGFCQDSGDDVEIRCSMGLDLQP